MKMFEHEPKPPDSVMKFLQDMYSCPETSSILYTNDAKVLVDIILRHLIDLSPGDPVSKISGIPGPRVIKLFSCSTQLS